MLFEIIWVKTFSAAKYFFFHQTRILCIRKSTLFLPKMKNAQPKFVLKKMGCKKLDWRNFGKALLLEALAPS
jgi:hypothetical protein